jgi:hypothetical protein
MHEFITRMNMTRKKRKSFVDILAIRRNLRSLKIYLRLDNRGLAAVRVIRLGITTLLEMGQKFHRKGPA